MNKWLGAIGVIASVAYGALVNFWVSGRWSDLSLLELNELGDFLAGAFGPLAVLWLVLGFFQQGVELRNSGNALQLQAKELRNSVEQQKELVQVGRRQITAQTAVFRDQRMQHQNAIRPRFAWARGQCAVSDGRHEDNFEFRNLGATARDVVISSLSSALVIVPNRFEFCRSDTGTSVRFTWCEPLDVGGVEIQLHFSDIEGRKLSQSFYFEEVGGGRGTSIREDRT